MSENTFNYNLPVVTEVVELHPKFAEGRVINTAAVREGVVYYTVIERDNEGKAVSLPGIYSLDLHTGKEAVFSPDAGEDARMMRADESGLIVLPVDTNAIFRLNIEDGAEVDKLPLPFEITNTVASGDGIVAAASWVKGVGVRDVVLIDRNSGKQTPLDFSDVIYTSVHGIAVLDRDHILVTTEMGTEERHSVYCFNSKGKLKASYSGAVVESPVYDDNTLWSMDGNGHVFRYSMRDEELVTEQTLMFPLRENPSLPGDREDGELIAADSSALLVKYYPSGRLFLYPRKNPDDALRILCNDTEKWPLSKAAEFAGAENCVAEGFNDAVYLDKLRAKLLAKDTDFDLAYVSGQKDDVTDFLASLVRQGAYIDLNRSTALQVNLSEMTPGVLSLMTLPDGTIPCLSIGIAPTIIERQDDTIPFDSSRASWTTKEFFALAEWMAEQDTPHAMFGSTYNKTVPIMLLQMLNGEILSRMDSDPDKLPEDTREIMINFLEECRIYCGEGVLIGQGIPAAFGIANGEVGKESQLLTLPAPEGGKAPVSLTGFWFINPNSSKIDKALDYLALLTNKENRYDLLILGGMLYPQWERYYYNPAGIDGEVCPFPNQTKEEIAALEKVYAEMYSSLTIDWLHVTDAARDAMVRFCDGKFTSEQTADILYKEYVYSIKG